MIENRHQRIEYLTRESVKHSGDYGRGLQDALNLMVSGKELPVEGVDYPKTGTRIEQSTTQEQSGNKSYKTRAQRATEPELSLNDEN